MELPSDVNKEKLDGLGAHFKYSQLFEKLQNVEVL